MPAGQPFTRLCQTLGRPPQRGRADLHLHTTSSDGLYTPAELVDLARRSGLAALAVTDHDTLAGVGPARAAAAATDGPEVCGGVEITAEFHGKELHLLGLFVDPEHAGLTAALDRLRVGRAARFWAMVQRLDDLGVPLPPGDVDDLSAVSSLGRRHLAELLVKARRVGTVREAFQRYLGDHGRVTVPKARLPVAEAIALVRAAGGVASWAHPSADGTRDALRELHALGMRAVEAAFPSCRPGRGQVLRGWAAELGLAVTGGSDCHGPGEPRRAVGACGVSDDEYRRLRQLALDGR